jgi:hypothetical protein
MQVQRQHGQGTVQSVETVRCLYAALRVSQCCECVV